MINQKINFDAIFIKILNQTSLLILFIYYIRYSNFLISSYIPWHLTHIDYFIYSFKFFLIRAFSLIIIFFTYTFNKVNYVLQAIIWWILVWILLSHEHDRFSFFIPPLITTYLVIFYTKSI